MLIMDEDSQKQGTDDATRRELSEQPELRTGTHYKCVHRCIYVCGCERGGVLPWEAITAEQNVNQILIKLVKPYRA